MEDKFNYVILAMVFILGIGLPLLLIACGPKDPSYDRSPDGEVTVWHDSERLNTCYLYKESIFCIPDHG